MASLDDIIQHASPSEQIVNVCVDGALHGEHALLSKQLEKEQEQTLSGRLGVGPSNTKETAQKIADVEKKMHEHSYRFVMRAMPAKRWSDLMAEHPDPKKNYNFDPATFIPAAIAESCTEPEGLDTVEAVNKLLAAAPHAQDPLWEAALSANVQGADIPFNESASEILHPSGKRSNTAQK